MELYERVDEVIKRIAKSRSHLAKHAPEGVCPLDYEAEEAAILKAAETTGLSLFVEESGALAPLRQRLSSEGPFQAFRERTGRAAGVIRDKK